MDILRAAEPMEAKLCMLMHNFPCITPPPVGIPLGTDLYGKYCILLMHLISFFFTQVKGTLASRSTTAEVSTGSVFENNKLHYKEMK